MTMSNYMHQELAFFCRAFLSGVILTVSYDILRIFRNVKAHTVVLIGIEDFLYWCMAGIFLFSMIYRENDGVIRIYTLCSAGLGALVYQKGMSSFVVRGSTWGLMQLGKLLAFPVRLIRNQRKRLKFQWDRVKIFLYKQKSIQIIRECIYGKNGKQKGKKSKEKESYKGKTPK